MYTPEEPVTSRLYPQFKLAEGMDVLDAWSRTATQATRNAVYRVLFAVAERSVFNRYRTVENYADPQEFYVYLHEQLVIRVRLDDCVFTVSYIGPAEGADAA